MTIDPIGVGLSTSVRSEPARSGGESFAKAMTDLLKEVNSDQISAANKIKELSVDGRGSIHETMVAMGTAEGSLRLLMEMRNRLVDGVNRLLQTQV
jgi:flagellar hook-basal body complex protein FliE